MRPIVLTLALFFTTSSWAGTFPRCPNYTEDGHVAQAMFQSILHVDHIAELSQTSGDKAVNISVSSGDSLQLHITKGILGASLAAKVCQAGGSVRATVISALYRGKSFVLSPGTSTTIHIAGPGLDHDAFSVR